MTSFVAFPKFKSLFSTNGISKAQVHWQLMALMQVSKFDQRRKSWRKWIPGLLRISGAGGTATSRISRINLWCIIQSLLGTDFFFLPISLTRFDLADADIGGLVIICWCKCLIHPLRNEANDFRPPGKFFTMFHFLEVGVLHLFMNKHSNFLSQYPFSRGSTHITSPDPYEAPDFDAGFMNDERDMAPMVWGYIKSRESLPFSTSLIAGV